MINDVSADMKGPPTSLRTINSLPQSQIGSLFHSQKNTFKIKRLIQTAIYGGVFECYMFIGNSSSNVRNVAVKIMLKDLEKKHRGKLQENIKAELNFQNEMKGHKNLLSYIETWTDPQAVYIVMPLAEHEDLFEVLKKRGTAFSERECRWLFAQLLEGAHILHTKGVAFRDYSVENILMFQDTDGTVYPRIADPGQAVNVQYNKNGDVKGLLAERLFGKCFRPPEVYIKRPYNPVKVDTFCLGWMLFYCLTKRQIFDKATSNDPNWRLLKSGRIRQLLETHNALPLSITVIDLLIRMLHPDFERWRYTPKQALGHPWFKGKHIPITIHTIYSPPAEREETDSQEVASQEKQSLKPKPITSTIPTSTIPSSNIAPSNIASSNMPSSNIPPSNMPSSNIASNSSNVTSNVGSKQSLPVSNYNEVSGYNKPLNISKSYRIV